jgi:hypothetical protein
MHTCREEKQEAMREERIHGGSREQRCYISKQNPIFFFFLQDEEDQQYACMQWRSKRVMKGFMVDQQSLFQLQDEEEQKYACMQRRSKRIIKRIHDGSTMYIQSIYLSTTQSEMPSPNKPICFLLQDEEDQK